MVQSPVEKSTKLISPQLYLKQALAELKKVVWPTRPQVFKLTLVVISASVVTGLFIGGLDYLFTRLMGLIIK